MAQVDFDFAPPPPVDPRSTSPTGEALELPPINGSTTASRHASYTGALHALETRSANIERLREVWREPRTMNEVHDITGLPLSSICSLKSAIDDELMEVGYQLVEWGEGRRPTKRTRWKVRT